MRIGHYLALTQSLFLLSVVVGRPISLSSLGSSRNLSAQNASNSAPDSLVKRESAVVVVNGPDSGSTSNSPFTVCVDLIDTGDGVMPSATLCSGTETPQAAITPDPSSSVLGEKDGYASIYTASVLKPNGPYIPSPSPPVQTSLVSQDLNTAGPGIPVTTTREPVLPTPPAANPTSVQPCSSTRSPPSDATPESLSPPRPQNPSPQRFPQTTSTPTSIPTEPSMASPPPPPTSSTVNEEPTTTVRIPETVVPTTPTAPSRAPVQQTAPPPPLSPSSPPPPPPNPDSTNSLEPPLSSPSVPSVSSPPEPSTATSTIPEPDNTGGINIIPMEPNIAVQARF